MPMLPIDGRDFSRAKRRIHRDVGSPAGLAGLLPQRI